VNILKQCFFFLPVVLMLWMSEQNNDDGATSVTDGPSILKVGHHLRTPHNVLV
jgi:hypothetical protein